MWKHGIIYLKRNGKMLQAEGEFTYNYGVPKREPVFGSGGKVIDAKEEPQAPNIKGEITIEKDTDIADIAAINGETVTLELDDDVTRVLREAVYMADGDTNTSDGKMQFEVFGKELKDV